MIPRPGRALPAMLVALIAAAAGITVVIDVIAVQTGRSSIIWPYRQMADQLRTSRWDDIAILAVAAAIAFIGLLLLMAALTPGRKTLVPLATDDPHNEAGASRRSISRTLGEAATQVDGVSRARVSLGRRAVRIRARSRLRDTSGLDQQIQAAVGQRLDQVGPLRPLRVRASVRRRKG